MLEDQKDKVSKIFGLKADNKWLIPSVLAAVFLLIFFIIGTLLVVFEFSYNQKFFPGSQIGNIKLTGLGQDKAYTLIEDRVNKLESEPIKVSLDDNGSKKILLISPIIDSEVNRSFFDYDIYKTINNNYQFGRQNNINSLWQQLFLALGLKKMTAVYEVDREYIKSQLINQLKESEVKELDATPKINCLQDVCQIEISAEKVGTSFNYDEAISNWLEGISKLNNNPLELKKITTQPQISSQDVSKVRDSIDLFLATTSTVEYYWQDKNFKLNLKNTDNLLEFQKVGAKVFLGINKDNFKIWFSKNIANSIDIEAKNATLQIVNGQINSLSTHINGRKADLEQAYNNLNSEINKGNYNNLRFEIKVNEEKPEVITGDVNELGITEIIGTGKSNFAGSPNNRRKNIKNGASKLNGILIKPGDEFSLIQTLLPVDVANGYFTELVIKDNKTIPEYGGGLCQVGTTMFRAALASGLPITERRNHSYSVTYYLENGLPGVDATIYDPKPDFRFKNDTENYILIQARIEGDNLYFDFWGTKDGRVATRTKPKTWGLKPPAPTKIIEVTTLAPGVKKCTESSHNGISASFDYIVAYNSGNTVTSTFTSIYKPWQAVCLVGVSASSSPEISSSTSDILPLE